MSIRAAYLLKGYLLDKNPPEGVVAAVDSIIATLERQPLGPSDNVASDQVGHTERQQPDEAAVKTAATSSAPTNTSDLPEKPKRQRNMSPEARAAAAERMRAYQAKRKAEREANSPGER